jgi:protoporphyrinogen oxidase
MIASEKIVIIGAGPCGLGAGWALSERKYRDWIILEKNNYCGGLSASFKDARGFTWDIGGQVLFSHYPEFDQVINSVMGDDMLSHIRKSFVRVYNRWVPYPFQNNLSFLPSPAQLECLMGLKETKRDFKAENFDRWIETVFGGGSKIFHASL